MRPHNGDDAARRRRRPRRREDASALAHGGEDAVGSLVCRRQLSRRCSAHGLVDGTRERPPVRRAGHVGHPADQGRVRVGHAASPAASVSVRYRRDAGGAGHELFYSEDIGCSRCHGDYDGTATSSGRACTRTSAPIRARLDVVSDGFIAAFDQSPLATEGRSSRVSGYAATPLTGVWANFPYLHNGSVPTLHHLLGPVSERPGIFHVMAAGRFDRDTCRPAALPQSSRRHARRGANSCAGSGRSRLVQHRAARCGNGGHDVWPRIRTDANRRALIEYLKTL